MTLLPTFTAGEFRKARASSPNQNCVRVARKDGWTAVWDDKRATDRITPVTVLPAGELLLFTDEQFDAYQASVRENRVEAAPLTVTRRADGMYVFRAATTQPVPDVELVFDQDELDAFLDGVRHREFDANVVVGQQL
ncbi:hypothetical protein NDR87_12180 [Nocardia sp. CDC159]|uniref:DUF397 domain-containing protein n=1 Tax=Nocardia pulmonis TaxID=2951408 RepID=A0A9X2E5V6_9NOCA|nr:MULTISPECIES: hypothetical protein [Nocardia]MCM6774230.1 hypothetical protein [Nocardia pulmonis]MCM6787117.1 hypothetical protein [Nocardia sp. CDC159]